MGPVKMQMSKQTFHVTGLDPRSALCGKSGHIWAAPHWPDDRDMRAGLFMRCKDCDRLSTPTLQAAIDSARNLEHAALAAYKAGWREGCKAPADPNEPDPAATEDIERECSELGRRVGALAARLPREARTADHHPPSARLDGTAATTRPIR